MKKAVILFTLSLFLTGAALAQEPDTVRVRLGQQRTADRGRVTIKFLSVLEDSRCPMNARCVWAGNAKIRIRVSKRGQAARTIELNSTTEPQAAEVFGLKLSLQDLLPQKGQPANWPKRPTTAVISITRAG